MTVYRRCFEWASSNSIDTPHFLSPWKLE